MSKPLWFDVTPYAPDRHENDSKREDNDNIYRHINFMIHLLWGVPYHSDDARATVHGPVKLLVDAMRANLNASDWPTEFTDAPGIIKPVLTEIEDAAKCAGGPSVSDLYFDVDKPGYKYGEVIEACRKLRSVLRTDGYDICLPFIDTFDTKRPPHSRIFANYSTKLTNLTLADLYVNPILNRTQRNAVVRLIRGGVFRPTSQTGGPAIESSYRNRSNGQGNGYKCKAGGVGCELANPNCFCSLDSAGNCSAMTTCY